MGSSFLEVMPIYLPIAYDVCVPGFSSGGCVMKPSEKNPVIDEMLLQVFGGLYA